MAILGGGAWGTALTCVLAPRFPRVKLWVHERDLAARIQSTRVNDVFLPGVRIPDQVEAVDSLEAALADAEIAISVMPSHVVRNVYSRMLPWLRPGTKIVSATKGLEEGTGNPTAVVVASDDESLAGEIQQRFSGPTFRVYGSADVTGVEIGGALKNVIAIGAGISDGLGLGHNAVAALITRGLAELTRLAVAAGARADTLAGLAGLGDLVLTCTGDLSRNRQVGLKLAKGLQLGEILASTPSVAEGVKTTSAALELAARYGVDLPITREMHAVLNQGRPPAEAIRNLMSRSLRSE